jgi:hypothetical protein
MIGGTRTDLAAAVLARAALALKVVRRTSRALSVWKRAPIDGMAMDVEGCVTDRTRLTSYARTRLLHLCSTGVFRDGPDLALEDDHLARGYKQLGGVCNTPRT